MMAFENIVYINITLWASKLSWAQNNGTREFKHLVSTVSNQNWKQGINGVIWSPDFILMP